MVRLLLAYRLSLPCGPKALRLVVWRAEFAAGEVFVPFCLGDDCLVCAGEVLAVVADVAGAKAVVEDASDGGG